jgi:type VI secretion system protein
MTFRAERIFLPPESPMREESLIDRLRDRSSSLERSAKLDTAALSESVMANLRRMLNSRQGISQTVPDYGLPDLTDIVHAFPEAIDVCRRSIRQSLEKYEPRLRNVIVTHAADDDDPFHLRFEIKAQLVLERDTVPIAFYTMLDASGQAKVRR